MRSQYAETFNHDNWADSYDNEVINKSDPIRDGYRRALDWLGSKVPQVSSVLDLGSGTGNAILVLPEDCYITAVDISSRMLAVAKSKLTSRKVRYVIADILEFFESQPFQNYNVIVSAYAIHHLTDSEKESLFYYIRSAIKPGGRAVFVDLMFQNKRERRILMEKYRNTFPDVYQSIEEEFFWDVDLAIKKLIDLDFRVSTTRFSELSFGIFLQSTANSVSGTII